MPTRNSHRAGRYVRQAAGYAAFIPEPLPPKPPLDFDDRLRSLLSQADQSLGRLDGSIQTLPNPDLFAFMYIRKEAVLSSQIEGTQSSLSDVLEAEAKIFDPERPEDVREVVNYVDAMSYGLERLKTLPLSIRLINEIHGRLLHDVRGQERSPGEVRRSQNRIGPPGSTLATAAFVPPPAHEIMPALGNLEVFANSNDALPPLVKIGLIHAQFETIHPYQDGNGRVGRLLITFLLCRDEILSRPVLYVSHFFKQHRSEYYERLQAVRDHGAWEDWIRFFLTGIASVSREATETARAIVRLREQHRAAVTAAFGRAAGSGLTVLEALFEQPVINVRWVRDKLGGSSQHAHVVIQRLVDAGILKETSGRERYRVFRYESYVALFAEDRGR